MVQHIACRKRDTSFPARRVVISRHIKKNVFEEGSYRVKLNILIKPKDAEDVKRATKMTSASILADLKNGGGQLG